MSREVRFGIIGSGLIADFHARALGSVRNARLVGVSGAVIEQTTDFARKYNIKAYSSTAELLASGEIDAVSICTPSGTHAEIAATALEAGKHVVIEKPMALTVADCDRVIEAEKKSGRVCTVVSQLRYSDSSAKVREAIAENRLGRLINCGVYMKFHRSPEYYSASSWRGTFKMDGGGALMNQGIHGVDLMLYFMGKVKTIRAVVKTLYHNIETEDTVVALLEFGNGALGVVEATTAVLPGYPRRFEICGTAGSIILEEDMISRWDIPGETIGVGMSAGGTSYDRPDSITVDGHIRQLNDFMSVITGGGECRVRTSDGREAVRLINAVYESARTGNTVTL
jgi:predicted dehydrogenase